VVVSFWVILTGVDPEDVVVRVSRAHCNEQWLNLLSPKLAIAAAAPA
jgi:hypothetical protein